MRCCCLLLPFDAWPDFRRQIELPARDILPFPSSPRPDPENNYEVDVRLLLGDPLYRLIQATTARAQALRGLYREELCSAEIVRALDSALIACETLSSNPDIAAREAPGAAAART